MIQMRPLSVSAGLRAAAVQKPAPNFTAQAVVDGQFKEVSLADYQVYLKTCVSGRIRIFKHSLLRVRQRLIMHIHNDFFFPQFCTLTILF